MVNESESICFGTDSHEAERRYEAETFPGYIPGKNVVLEGIGNAIASALGWLKYRRASDRPTDRNKSRKLNE